MATCAQESTTLTSPHIYQKTGACYYKPAEAEKKYLSEYGTIRVFH